MMKKRPPNLLKEAYLKSMISNKDPVLDFKNGLYNIFDSLRGTINDLWQVSFRRFRGLSLFLNSKAQSLTSIFTFLLTFIVVGVGFSVRGSAVDGVINRANQGFSAPSYKCGSGFVHIADGGVPFASDYPKIVSDYPSLCISTSTVNGIAKYGGDWVGTDEIYICKGPTEFLAYKPRTGNFATSYCCHGEGLSFYSSRTKCCDNNDLSFTDLNSGLCNTSSGDTSAVISVSNEIEVTDTSYFMFGEKIIICEANGCISDGGNGMLQNDGTSIGEGNFNNGFQCAAMGQLIIDKNGNSLNKVCVDGETGNVVGESTIKDIGGFNQFITCLNAGDDQEACKECFFKNDPSIKSAFIWTSLGCVDTSATGIVTRMFQIGLGLIGGFAVWKIVSAAFMFQQADPAKHEQAREEITSVFWAIILMVGAVVILNFIGVNVLGIFSSPLVVSP